MASALAIYTHIESLVQGNERTTMGCISNGEYNTTPGSVFGFPVSVTDGAVSIREVGTVPEKLQEIILLQDSQLSAEKKVKFCGFLYSHCFICAVPINHCLQRNRFNTKIC